MRLILLHGINQQGKNEQKIKEGWLGALEQGLGRKLNSNVEVVAPFYGDLLSSLSKGEAMAVAQGSDGTVNQEEARFLASALEETAGYAGISNADIANEQNKVAIELGQPPQEQSFLMNRRINAIVRLIERASPFHGNLALRLVEQAYAYLKKPGAGGQVDAIVRPIIDSGPSIIVAHSLGTIVTFKILRQLALESRPVKVPLYVTLGSPLAISAVKAALGPAFSRPTEVNRWLNAIDPNDSVTLGKALDAKTFSKDIDNILDIKNDEKEPHAITDYLKDKRVAQAIAQACEG